MTYTFQIDPAARFSRGNDGDSVALMREKLFGKSPRKAGLRANTSLIAAEKPAANRSVQMIKSDQAADRKSAALRQRIPVEYQGHRQIDDATASTDSTNARREFLRIPVSLKGTMFASNGEHDCQILDLSAGGARLQCADPAALTGELTLYIEGFGRYHACVIPGRTDLCLRFIVGDELVLSLLKGLSGYVKGYSPAQTKLRRETRVAAPIATVCQDTDGTAIPCEIINASMQGMSVAMTPRPQVGTLVTLGRTRLRVVRHHELGIAVQQLSVSGGKAASRYAFSN